MDNVTTVRKEIAGCQVQQGSGVLLSEIPAMTYLITNMNVSVPTLTESIGTFCHVTSRTADNTSPGELIFKPFLKKKLQ
jgi:hypothetical protein